MAKLHDRRRAAANRFHRKAKREGVSPPRARCTSSRRSTAANARIFERGMEPALLDLGLRAWASWLQYAPQEDR